MTGSHASPRTRQPRLIRYVAGVLASLATALVVGALLLRPPLGDLTQMAMLLSATAALSVVAGYAAYRWRWIDRAPRLAYSLLGGYVLATALTILNVWISARLMFLNQHDLMLGASLLIFAGGIAIALGAYFSDAITERLEHLRRFASDLTLGNLDARVSVSGRDEVADLARSLNQMARQLEDGQRRQQEMDSMRRELLAWVGHDLRTPLASVQAIVEALADGLVEDPEISQRYLRTAQRDIQSLSGLIDDLFEMAQIEAGGLQLHLQQGSMTDLASDTIEGFHALAEASGIALTGSVTPDVDPVAMDVQRIGRVLDNLVSNALRHTPPGGSVRLEAERVDDGIRASVRDTGEGIDEVRLGRVFERFAPGQPARQGAGGSGLGLAIARGIVEAHGGQIGIESQLGHGTRVWFQLPRSPRSGIATLPQAGSRHLIASPSTGAPRGNNG